MSDAAPMANAHPGDALFASERRYRRLLETALEGILFLDAKGTITFANQRFVQMLGYDSSDELIGRPLIFLFFPEDEWRARSRWASRLAGVQEEYELRLRRKDGEVCWAIAHVTIERDEKNGAFSGTFTMFTDITERRRAQEELVAKNLEILTIFERVTDAFAAFDTDWRFTYLNHEAERILRRRSEDLIGVCLWDIFPGIREGALYQECLRAQATQKPVDFEYHSSYLHRWFEARAYPSLTGLSMYFRDITERKYIEIEREEAAQEKARLVAELVEAGKRQRGFLREILSILTENRLHLCAASDELPAPLPHAEAVIALNRNSLRHLRRRADLLLQEQGVGATRRQDFVTAIGEASMNAVVHGGGGEGQICRDDAGNVQVWIRDKGPGIAEDVIHRALLEKGYSSAGTLGHGFWMMLQTAENLYVFTGPGGTTIVLEMARIDAQRPGF